MSLSGAETVDPASLHYADLVDTASQIATGRRSAEQVTQAALARIAQVDVRLGAYVEVMADEALASARAADSEWADGRLKGPLHGVPLAIKDVFRIAGHPMAAGMAMHRKTVSCDDATVVRRLREAGAILLGRVTLTEGAYAEHRQPFPAPLNPWHEHCWSGASSSGSAVAVAAGLACASIASETGGSTKLPSAANGVSAIKPTWGRISRHGMFELAGSLDHVGVMARSVRDLASVLDVIAGPDPLDPSASAVPVPDYRRALDRPTGPLRIGVDSAWTSAGVHRDVRAALEGAVGVLEDLGASVRPVALPDPTDMLIDWFGICSVQTAIAHETSFPSRAQEYGHALAELLKLGHRLSGVELQRMQSRRERFRSQVEAVFDAVDLLALPVMAVPTPSIERMRQVDEDVILALHRFTGPFAMSGHPGVVLPCGFSAQGTPIAIQLVGPYFSEERLLSAGASFQQVTDWHRVHPNLAADR